MGVSKNIIINIETIVKLLKSDNEEDYTLGYELLIHEYKTERRCNDKLHETGCQITLHHFDTDNSRYMFRGGILHPEWEEPKYVKNI